MNIKFNCIYINLNVIFVLINHLDLTILKYNPQVTTSIPAVSLPPSYSPIPILWDIGRQQGQDRIRQFVALCDQFHYTKGLT